MREFDLVEAQSFGAVWQHVFESVRVQSSTGMKL